MLKHRKTFARRGRARQQGLVLIVALIVLVAITIAGAAMMRSVDTSTLVSGNLAFQQAATHSADKGIEQALAMLRQKDVDGSLDTNDRTNGYFATRSSADNPASGQSWQEFWQATLKDLARDAGEDQFKNHIYYVVHRECAFARMPGDGGFCVASPANTESTRSSEGLGAVNPKAATSVYYRITVRVLGPRRTESYVQSYVAM
jgi:type IV pilus assembly protein PilX